MLASELAAYKRDGDSPSETWVKKFKYIADQLRRDYRLDGEVEQVPASEEETADPLQGLKLVKKEAG